MNKLNNRYDCPTYMMKFMKELYHTKLLDYFKDTTKRRKGDGVVEIAMIRFKRGEWVPGGAWPGNFGTVTITDYRKKKEPRGRRKVMTENGYNYEDWKGMNELIPAELKSIAELRNDERQYAMRSVYALPDRLRKIFSDRLIIKINGDDCSGSSLSDEMLVEARSMMTDEEKVAWDDRRSKQTYEYKLDPSIEFPVRMRIDGDDDGAAEICYPDVEMALMALKVMEKNGGSHDLIYNALGLKATD